MEDPFHRPAFVAAVYYEKPMEALDWLERAFGFARSVVITTQERQFAHSQMTFEDGLIHVGTLWADHVATPRALGGKNTQSLRVNLKNGLDAHCARARAAGAQIVREPEDQFFGDRVYAAKDPEGHYWTFGQPVKVVSREEAEQASGLRIEGWL